MAKTTRVYELARDLNMTNKDLLERLKEMDIPVGSHMSSLDEEAVDSIKDNLRGKAAGKGQIEETRVKPTVIRRRKKVVKAKPVEEKPEDEATEAAPDEAVEAETVAEEAVQPTEPEKPAAPKKNKN